MSNEAVKPPVREEVTVTSILYVWDGSKGVPDWVPQSKKVDTTVVDRTLDEK